MSNNYPAACLAEDRPDSRRSLLDGTSRPSAQLSETAHELVDHVAHEFRTPLTVIKEFVAVIHDGLAGPVNEQQREFLEIVDDRADDLALLVDDMLDVSKFEAGLLRVWRKRSSLGEILAQVRPALERKATVKKVALATSLENNLPEVFCDSESIGQVIANLVVNAIKTCGDDGAVKLWAQHQPESAEVLVGVTDNGSGIAPEDLETIYRSLRQSEGRSPSSPMGIGLGLSIARELIGLHYGQMDVESEAGQGSTFSFTLPVWDPAHLAARCLQHFQRRRPTPGHATLLIAEIPSSVDPAVCVVVDEFLQNALAAYDLILPVESHRWLIITQCGKDEVTQAINHVRLCWAEAGRDQPEALRCELRLRAGGTWQLETQRDGILQRFRAELPAAPDRAASCRVLLVDDDRAVLRALAIRLGAAGYQALSASAGEEALRVASQEQPDAIVMDNCMPGLTGVDTLVRLRQQPDTVHIPVIILSASPRDQAKAIQHGARGFLQKPCEIQTLIGALRQVTGEPASAAGGAS